MPTCLYLDTARLGCMCPEAQAADRDFARLASEEGCSLYFEHFLRWGFGSLPPSLAKHYPGLSFWAGVTAFKRDLKTVLALDRDRTVLIANRSAQLVRLAARLLCDRCQNILVTDMEWPVYMAALEAECRQSGRILTTVPIRQAILRDCMGLDELNGLLVNHYLQHDCDGLFLSAVTYEGVRLPIRQFVRSLGPRRRPRMVVIDGAQALNHVPLNLPADCCDLLLTGCHKWLRAYHPLGLAIICRAASESLIGNVCHEMLLRGELDDPLLSFTSQLEVDNLQPFSETVSLVPLFTAAAAVRAMIRSGRTKQAEFASQLDNADRAVEQSDDSLWHPMRPATPLRTGILLFKAANPEAQSAPPDRLRRRFLCAGIALTTYLGGLLRASLPSWSLRASELNLLYTAFRRCD